jgi:hypothetical protein
MATRGTIALEYADGTVDQVYCHWDNYLEGNGRILKDHYTDPFKLQQLIDLGDLSVLEAEIGEQHPFDNPHTFGSRDYEQHRAKYGNCCTFYGRDRGEQDTKACRFWNFEMYQLSGQCEEYNYILRQVDGKAQWFVSMDNSKNFISLDEALAQEKALEDQ